MDTKLLELYGNRMEFPGRLLSGNPQDYVGMALSVSCTIFFRWGWQEEKKEAICKALDKYMSCFGSEIKWVFSDEEPGKGNKQEYKKTEPLRKLYKKWDDNVLVYRKYKGGNTFDDASPYSFLIGSRRKWKSDKFERAGEIGMDVVRFSVPLPALVQHPKVFQEMVLELADGLDALHGFAGLSTELSPDQLTEEPTEAWQAQRWNGMSVGDDFLASGRLATTRIKTVSWLTIIGQDIIPKADYQWLRSELPPSWFAFYEYKTGVIVQSGPAPDPAPLSSNPLPATYVLPNMLLKPFRAEDCTIHLNTGLTPLIATKEARSAWLSRFDVPEDQLDVYKAKLTKMPCLKQKHVLMDAIDPRLQPLYK
ncbi:type VI immunity family protein [Zymobacter palmae]|nr:type VI immunity family protein [Zymobacter palmae]